MKRILSRRILCTALDSSIERLHSQCGNTPSANLAAKDGCDLMWW